MPAGGVSGIGAGTRRTSRHPAEGSRFDCERVPAVSAGSGASDAGWGSRHTFLTPHPASPYFSPTVSLAPMTASPRLPLRPPQLRVSLHPPPLPPPRPAQYLIRQRPLPGRISPPYHPRAIRPLPSPPPRRIRRRWTPPNRSRSLGNRPNQRSEECRTVGGHGGSRCSLVSVQYPSSPPRNDFLKSPIYHHMVASL